MFYCYFTLPPSHFMKNYDTTLIYAVLFSSMIYCRRHEEEAKKLDEMLSNDSMMFPQRTQRLNPNGHSYHQSGRMFGFGFRWPETELKDLVFYVTDEEDEEGDE